MVGVMKISRLDLIRSLVSLRKRRPRPGISPRNGTLLVPTVRLSDTRPHRTKVNPLGIKTVVSMILELKIGTEINNTGPVLKVTSPAWLETSGRTLRLT